MPYHLCVFGCFAFLFFNSLTVFSSSFSHISILHAFFVRFFFYFSFTSVMYANSFHTIYLSIYHFIVPAIMWLYDVFSLHLLHRLFDCVFNLFFLSLFRLSLKLVVPFYQQINIVYVIQFFDLFLFFVKYYNKIVFAK